MYQEFVYQFAELLPHENRIFEILRYRVGEYPILEKENMRFYKYTHNKTNVTPLKNTVKLHNSTKSSAIPLSYYN